MRSLRRSALLLTLLLLLPGGAAEETGSIVFHVAPGGKDTNPGTKALPFASLEKARDAVRARQERGKPVTVLIAGGTYLLERPLVLTPDDSGTKAAPVTYRAAGKDTPVLSGGRAVTGWKETAIGGKTLWVADLPEVRAGHAYYRQLWINGERRARAKHPNKGFLQIAALPPATKKDSRYEGQNTFTFKDGDLRAWDNLSDVEVVVMHLWVDVHLPVVSVDEKTRQASFSAKSLRRLVDGGKPARYYVVNARELLDEPGEWYLDRTTGKLTYWPMPDEKLDAVQAMVARLPDLLRLEGKPESKRTIDHVHFRGLSFQHAEWTLPRDKAGDLQAAVSVPAAVRADGMRHGSFEDCEIARVSGYALHLERGCQDNRVVGCHLHDLGAGGVRVGETALRADLAQQTHGQIVSDNHIHAGGRLHHQAIGVWVGQSYNNRIVHNHIHDLYYTGVSVGWTWGYGKTLARDNKVEYNHIHDLGKAWLSDMGGFYSLGMQPGTVVRNNVFHDIEGLHYGGWGVYFDEGSTDIVAENNLVYRTTHSGFHQHYGRNNVVRNNILALGRHAQLQRSRLEEHLSFTVEGNIIYGKGEQFLLGRWDGPVKLDRNLYWRPDGPIRFGRLTFEQWQKQGHDTHSLIADPLFIDPAKGDFRLKPGSPAAKIGFKMPDFSTVGIRPADRRDR